MNGSLSLRDYVARIEATPVPAFAELAPIEWTTRAVRLDLESRGLALAGPRDEAERLIQQIAVGRAAALAQYEEAAEALTPGGRPNKVLADLIVMAVFMKEFAKASEGPTRGRRHRAHVATARRIGPYLTPDRVKHACNRTLDRLSALDDMAPRAAGPNFCSLAIRQTQRALDFADFESRGLIERGTPDAEEAFRLVRKIAAVLTSKLEAERTLLAVDASA